MVRSRNITQIANEIIDEQNLILCYQPPIYLDQEGKFYPSSIKSPSNSRYFVTDQFEAVQFDSDANEKLAVAYLERIHAIEHPSALPQVELSFDSFRELVAGEGMIRTLGFLPNSTGVHYTAVDAFSFFIIDEDDDLADEVDRLLRERAAVHDPWDKNPDYFKNKVKKSAPYFKERIEEVYGEIQNV